MKLSNVRISKPAIRYVLGKYLSDELAADMFNEMVRLDEEDQEENIIGMTVGEFMDRFEPDDLRIVWADDTRAGFGRRGDSVYGNVHDCIICRISQSQHTTTLHVWCKPLSSQEPFIIAAVNAYDAQHKSEV